VAVSKFVVAVAIIFIAV